MSTYSSNLKIELIATGDQSGVWGVTTNDNFSNVFEQSIVGRVTVSFSNADVTLTATNTVASQDYRNVYLNCTGTNAASRNLIVPTLNKNYIVENNTTGGFSIVVKTSAGTGITIPNGSKCAVYVDGTNVVQNDNYFPAAVFASITDSGLTSGRVTYAGTAGLLQDSANLTFNGTTLTAATGANFVTTSGSVGVGTASPQALLHVGAVAEAPGFGTTTQMLYVNGTSQPELLIRETTNDVVVSMYADSTSGSIRTATNHPLVFFTNNTDRMRLDTSGNLGLGVTPSAWASGTKAFETSSIALYNYTTANFYMPQNAYFNGTNWIYKITSGASYYQQAQGSHTWNIAPSGTAGNAITFTQAMTLDASGQLGIGTSSPNYKLHVSGTGAVSSRTYATDATGDASFFVGNNDSKLAGPLVYGSTKTAYGALGSNETAFYSNTSTSIMADGASAVIKFAAGGNTERMRIDSSGNVGIGVTPSAWNTYKALEIGTVGNSISGGVSSTLLNLTNNAYYNSGWKYANSTTGASLFQTSGGASYWYINNTSGTAGNAISFTQAMTLDASGQLSVGTTTAVAPLTVSGQTTSTSTPILYLKQGGSAPDYGYAFKIDNQTTGSLFLNRYDNPNTDIGTLLTVTTAGNVGIGNSSPGSKLVVGNGTASEYIDVIINGGTSSNYGPLLGFQKGGTTFGQIANYGRIQGGTSSDFFITSVGSNAVVFGINQTEKARIDTSGNLLVNATATGAFFDGKITSYSPDTYAPFAGKQGSSAASVTVLWNAGTTGDNIFEYFLTETSPTVRGTISYNRAGGLVAYNVTSDYRAKDIIGPVTDSGALIDSVPVYMGKMKDATQERPMFIAHETPVYAHTGVKDAVDKDGKPVYQQMDASSLIPVMWAEIQSLRQRIATLENK